MVTRKQVAIGGAVVGGIAQVAYLLWPRVTPPPPPPTCPNGDLIEEGGVCPPNYIPDLQYTGCCYPLVQGNCAKGDIETVDGKCPNCWMPDPTDSGCCTVNDNGCSPSCAGNPCSLSCPYGTCPEGQLCSGGACVPEGCGYCGPIGCSNGVCISGGVCCEFPNGQSSCCTPGQTCQDGSCG